MKDLNLSTHVFPMPPNLPCIDQAMRNKLPAAIGGEETA